MSRKVGFVVVAASLSLLGCPPVEKKSPEVASAAVDVVALAEKAKNVFGPLPADPPVSAENPLNDFKVELGRLLYFEKRLSKNHDISCNTCHDLATFGVDHKPTSPGHRDQPGVRNSPTVFNSALQFTQFWDGRAKDVEEQAIAPILNPIEMAMPSEEAVLKVLRSIPEYVEMFGQAFPGEGEPLTYKNVGNAIGAYERTLQTPGPFDEFLNGKHDALTAEQIRGLGLFMDTGCTICHTGPVVGGMIFQKLGLVKPFESTDQGRFEETKNETDRMMFKVPQLRNIAETGPYMHNGKIKTLEEMVKIMLDHQLGKSLQEDEIKAVVAFMKSLTGKVDPMQTREPELPPSTDDTPKPDPN